MVWIENTLWCDGCGVEILWAPVIFNNQHYCCEKCLRGEECDCAQRQEEDDEQREKPSSPPSWT